MCVERGLKMAHVLAENAAYDGEIRADGVGNETRVDIEQRQALHVQLAEDERFETPQCVALREAWDAHDQFRQRLARADLRLRARGASELHDAQRKIHRFDERLVGL